MSEMWVYADIIVIALYIFVGSVGNLLIILAAATTKKLRTTTNTFIINMAISDLLVASIGMPTVLANVITKGNTLSSYLCISIGWLIVISCGVSLISLGMIAFNRFIIICHGDKHETIFRKGYVVAMVVAVWLFSVGTVVVTYFSGACDYRYDPRQYVCTFDNRYPDACTYVLVCVGIVMPCFLIFLFYIRIYSTVRKVSKKMRAHVADDPASMVTIRRNGRARTETRVAVMMFVATVIFMLVWFPFGVVMIVDKYIKTEPRVVQIVTWLAFSNPCINWIVYGAMNKNFQVGYKNVILFWKKQTESIQSWGVRTSARLSHRKAVSSASSSQTNDVFGPPKGGKGDGEAKTLSVI